MCYRWGEPLLCAVLFGRFSHVQLFVTPWTVASQAPPSMGFSRRQYWSGFPCPPPGIFPAQGSNPGLLHCRQILYPLSHQEGRSPTPGPLLLYQCLSDPPLTRGTTILIFCEKYPRPVLHIYIWNISPKYTDLGGGGHLSVLGGSLSNLSYCILGRQQESKLLSHRGYVIKNFTCYHSIAHII